MLRRMLVAFDGSPKSYEAFEYTVAIAGACKLRSEIFVISVAQPPEPIDFVEMDDIVEAASKHYEALQKELEDKAHEKGIHIRSKIAVGHPADQIVKFAKEKHCDMIILGQRGKSTIEGWLLGSVSKRVASHAHCAVTIIK
ncbi:MAG: universal stress protein [Nitrospiraceae bacterium]|nr:universal stress protein [Nitrospiraceae bacterium]